MSARRDAALRAMPWVFVLIWSTGFVVARLAMPHSPPFSFLTVRSLHGKRAARHGLAPSSLDGGIRLGGDRGLAGAARSDRAPGYGRLFRAAAAGVRALSRIWPCGAAPSALKCMAQPVRPSGRGAMAGTDRGACLHCLRGRRRRAGSCLRDTTVALLMPSFRVIAALTLSHMIVTTPLEGGDGSGGTMKHE